MGGQTPFSTFRSLDSTRSRGVTDRALRTPNKPRGHHIIATASRLKRVDMVAVEGRSSRRSFESGLDAITARSVSEGIAQLKHVDRADPLSPTKLLKQSAAAGDNIDWLTQLRQLLCRHAAAEQLSASSKREVLSRTRVSAALSSFVLPPRLHVVRFSQWSSLRCLPYVQLPAGNVQAPLCPPTPTNIVSPVRWQTPAADRSAHACTRPHPPTPTLSC